MFGQPPARRTTWFRAGRRLEEHLLTANLFLDKTLAANIPVWILSLDLSKAFGSSRLGCVVVSFVRTGGVNSHVMDSSNPILWSTWWGHWTKREQPYLSNQCRRATRMCAEPKNVFCSTSLGNVKVANMGGRMFVWIWSWWWLATTFGLKICRWYLDIRKIFPGDNEVVGQTGSILGWCRPEIECRKNCVDHNRGSTTTVLDYLDWSRDQGKGKGIRSQMVGLHVIFSRFKKWSSGYWLSFAICKSRLLCQQIDISEPKCVHQKQTEIFRCHRDTNCLFWSWAPVHPCCRYG